MNRRLFFVPVLTLALVHPPSAHAQATESSITKQIESLRTTPDAKRPAAAVKITQDIDTFPSGSKKLELADALSHRATEADSDRPTLQAVANTLSKALAETPVPAHGDKPPAPYMDLARLVRYEDLTTPLKDPLYDQAQAILAANDADVAKADFTLKDPRGKKYTLSELRGRIVLINFWSTKCIPCRQEIIALDNIATHIPAKDLIVLAIDDEDLMKIIKMTNAIDYHPVILLDAGGKVAKSFHVQEDPRTFVFNAEGKLIAQSIEPCTLRQFLIMLAKAGLHA